MSAETLLLRGPRPLHAPRRPSLRSLFAELRWACPRAGHVPGCRGAVRALTARDHTLGVVQVAPSSLLHCGCRTVRSQARLPDVALLQRAAVRCCCALAALVFFAVFGGWVTYEVMWMLGYAELLPIDVFES